MPNPNALRFDSGRLCLDLLATVGSRPTSSPIERLSSAGRLSAWLVGAGLVPAGQDVPVDEEWLARFQQARALIHRVVHAVLDGGVPGAADRRALNALASEPPATPVLTEDERHAVVEPVRCEQLLSVVARDAVGLVGGDARDQLHECEGTTCDMVFVDTSRGRRRRWCSSTACGNRDRVVRHRERVRA